MRDCARLCPGAAARVCRVARAAVGTREVGVRCALARVAPERPGRVGGRGAVAVPVARPHVPLEHPLFSMRELKLKMCLSLCFSFTTHMMLHCLLN